MDATWFAIILLCVSAGVGSVILLRRRNARLPTAVHRL